MIGQVHRPTGETSKAVLEMMAKRDDKLREHLETGRKNAQYTSRIILNEVIDVVTKYIRKDHTRSFEDENAFFSIMAMRSQIHMVTKFCQCA